MTSKANINRLIVSLNSNKVLEYHRDRKLTSKQIQDLDKAEKKLAAGVHFAGKFISSPSAKEKAVFMANQIALALDEDNEAALAISCAYLATRYPDLKQLKLTTIEGQLSIELINDKEFSDQAPIKFIDKKDLI